MRRRDFVRAAAAALPAVFLVSWNEHLEGSAVEWTDEHGHGYLMAASRVLRD